MQQQTLLYNGELVLTATCFFSVRWVSEEYIKESTNHNFCRRVWGQRKISLPYICRQSSTVVIIITYHSVNFIFPISICWLLKHIWLLRLLFLSFVGNFFLLVYKTQKVNTVTSEHCKMEIAFRSVGVPGYSLVIDSCTFFASSMVHLTLHKKYFLASSQPLSNCSQRFYVEYNRSHLEDAGIFFFLVKEKYFLRFITIWLLYSCSMELSLCGVQKLFLVSIAYILCIISCIGVCNNQGGIGVRLFWLIKSFFVF